MSCSTFVNPVNTKRMFSILKEGKRCNLQQEYQFFETPAEVADWLVMLAGGIHENDTVLEPSAGRAAVGPYVIHLYRRARSVVWWLGACIVLHEEEHRNQQARQMEKRTCPKHCFTQQKHFRRRT